MIEQFIGTGVALITPFNDDLSIDHKTLSELVEFNISNKIEYLVVSGTTGESVTITKEEKKAIIKTVLETNRNRVPVILGVGGNNTRAILNEISDTDFTGIDAILSVSPYYSKPTQEGIYQHFKAISAVSPLPIILYNVPGRTSSNMLPETIVRLAKDFDNIIAVKEAGNNVAQYLRLLKQKPDNFLVLSGDDDLALGITLAGGSGVISVIGQAFPSEFSEMIRLGLKGDAKASYEYHFRLMDITSYIFEENNPAGIKAVLADKGIGNGKVRLPLVSASKQLQSKIQAFNSEF